MAIARINRAFFVISALVLLLAACGGDSAEERLVEEILENSGENIGDVDIDLGSDGEDFSISIQGEDGQDISISGSGEDEDFSMTVEGEDGEVMTFGGGEVPDDLTVPYPSGGEVTGTFSSENDVTVAFIFPKSEFDSIVSFYDDALDPDSDDVQRNESSFSSEEGTQRSVFWYSGTGDFQVTVTDCYGLEGELDSACLNIYETK